MVEDIRRICSGIATKFHLRSEEEQLDLASDAFLQITNKLVSGRLVYMPGRAPVFNLLTTTTYRIIYSILNKKNSQRDSVRKFIDDAAAGILPTAGRSVRVPHMSLIKRWLSTQHDPLKHTVSIVSTMASDRRVVREKYHVNDLNVF